MRDARRSVLDLLVEVRLVVLQVTYRKYWQYEIALYRAMSWSR
jgi:hypothetical protein